MDDRDFVFVLPADDRDPETKVAGGRILQIDYFHGLIGGIPMRRFGDVRDIGEAVRFLVTSGTYMTGQSLRVDGGRTT